MKQFINKLCMVIIWTALFTFSLTWMGAVFFGVAM